jgi:hypothetical protein
VGLRRTDPAPWIGRRADDRGVIVRLEFSVIAAALAVALILGGAVVFAHVLILAGDWGLAPLAALLALGSEYTSAKNCDACGSKGHRNAVCVSSFALRDLWSTLLCSEDLYRAMFKFRKSYIS